ncbi:MAG: TetR/AcrR family transcriptional regulator C-terminal domain-containing protein [Ilumatobacteraceae bacterium]
MAASLISQSRACRAARRTGTPSWNTEPASSTTGTVHSDSPSAAPHLDRLVAADDLHSALINFATTLQAAVLSPDVIGMRRLVAAEADRFPQVAARYLADSWTKNLAALGDTIAELAANGRVRAADPWLAAHQFTWTAVGAALNARTIGGTPARTTRRDLERFAVAAAVAIELPDQEVGTSRLPRRQPTASSPR